MSEDEPNDEPNAASVLAEMTGRPREVFEWNGGG